MRYLAMVLLTPWLLVICWAYWAYPKSLPATARRRSFDVVVILLAMTAAAQAAVLGFEAVQMPVVGQFGMASGGIWQQVLPALYGYGAFLVVMVLALGLRAWVWARPR